MRILNFGNDYANERNIRKTEKELVNVENSIAAESPQNGTKSKESEEQPNAETASKQGRKKKETKDEKAETKK